MAIDRAASACLGEGQIWDISDTERPRTIARIHNSSVEFWHSATFPWDGRTAVFGDEAGGGTQPRCREGQDLDTLGGAVVLRRREPEQADDTTIGEPLSHRKVPRYQGEAN